MNIHECPSLCARLGAHEVDAIAFYQAEPYKPSTKRIRSVPNPHRNRLMWAQFGEDQAVDDILSGICRLDYGTEKSLNPARLFVLLKSADMISSELIEAVMRLQERQARRYMAAVKLAIKHLDRHFANTTQEAVDGQDTN